MKKAKFMLAAIAAVGIVGTGMAFAAHRSPNVAYFTYDQAQGTCSPAGVFTGTVVDPALSTTSFTDATTDPSQVSNCETNILYVGAE